jgi:hypothetical protein
MPHHSNDYQLNSPPKFPQAKLLTSPSISFHCSCRFPILCPLSVTNKKNANTARSNLSQLCGGYGVQAALLFPPSNCTISTRPQLTTTDITNTARAISPLYRQLHLSGFFFSIRNQRSRIFPIPLLYLLLPPYSKIHLRFNQSISSLLSLLTAKDNFSTSLLSPFLAILDSKNKP